MTILGVDLSHWQGSPNFAQVKASGRDFVVLKATEGTSYADPSLTTNRRNAHAAGLIVGLYHFARAGNPAAEALYFLRTIGPLQPGEFLVLDQEITNTVGWCQTWLDTVYHATGGVRPQIYMNQSPNTGLYLGNWTGVAANYGLWLAKYDQSTAQPSVPYWGAPAMKQFYDKGVVPGIAGPCDVNVFYGTRDQLLAYGKGGTQPTPPPPPAPPVMEDDMPAVLRDPDGTIWLYTSEQMVRVPPSNGVLSVAQQKLNAGRIVDITWPEVDALSADVDQRRNDLAASVWAYVKTTGEPIPYDRLSGIDGKTGATQAAVAKLQTGGVDPAEVATLVLTGIKAQMSADVPPPAAS